MSNLLPVLPIETMFTKCAGFSHEFYLSGPVLPPENYVDWFNMFRAADVNDTITIYINCPGGSLTTTIQLLRAMAECRAEIICSVEGECMSAATMIFLRGDILQAADHSIFMFHNYSGGTIGKGGEMYSQMIHEKMWSESLLRDVYKDFLTPAEIDGLLTNDDIWMDSDQVMERVRIMAETRIAAAQEAAAPKPKRKKKA